MSVAVFVIKKCLKTVLVLILDFVNYTNLTNKKGGDVIFGQTFYFETIRKYIIYFWNTDE